MSEFQVPILRLDSVTAHPNADRLDIAQIGGYQTIVLRGAFSAGDLAVYVPEGALVPDWILKQEGLDGKLSGGGRNRVKAIKLRGTLSQGLVFRPANYAVPQEETDDVASLLGIEKYEPTIPAHLAGQVGALHGYTMSYDIENIKRYPNLIELNEYVVLTEKLHGTYCQIGWCADLEPRDDLFADGRAFVTSKGIAKHGQYLKNTPENANNLYVRTVLQGGLIERIVEQAKSRDLTRVYVMGEIFGDVQDLKYGMRGGQTEFRMFDIYIQTKDFSGYVNFNELRRLSGTWQIPIVPLIEEGLWGDIKQNLIKYTKGSSKIGMNIREGVVIKPAIERRHPRYGRVILKSVSEDYLLRGGETTELA